MAQSPVTNSPDAPVLCDCYCPGCGGRVVVKRVFFREGWMGTCMSCPTSTLDYPTRDDAVRAVEENWGRDEGLMAVSILPRHRISVSGLRELLSGLRDDDVLIPNECSNLAIMRNGEYVGFIELLEGRHRVERLPLRQRRRLKEER